MLAFWVSCLCLLDSLSAGFADRVAHQLVAVRSYSFPAPPAVVFVRADQFFQRHGGRLLIIIMEEIILKLINCHGVFNIFLKKRRLEWSQWPRHSADWGSG